MGEKRHRQRAGRIGLAVACLLSLLAACQQRVEDAVNTPNTAAAVVAQTPGSGKNDGSMQEHLFKRQPQPAHAYEVAVEIQGAPGPLVLLGGSASYQATGCTYVVDAWAGVRSWPEKVLPLTFTPQDGPSGPRFVSTVYRDAMLDEDYYGNGVCQWDFTGFAVGFSATGKPSEVSFSARMSLRQLLDMKPVTLYYLKRNYGQEDTMGMPIFGVPELERILPEHRGDVFTITLSAKERS